MNIADNNDGYVEEDAVYETTAYMAETVISDIPDETDYRVKKSIRVERSHVDIPDFPYIRFVADDPGKPYEA